MHAAKAPYMYPAADGRNIVYILDVGDTRAVIDTLYTGGRLGIGPRRGRAAHRVDALQAAAQPFSVRLVT